MMFDRDEIETGSGPLTIIPVHHASFVVTFASDVVYFDPVGGAARYDTLPRPTLIVLTHHHSDHLDIETLDALSNETTDYVAPMVVYEQLPSDMKARCTLMANGDKAEVHGIAFEAIPMYNTTPDRQKYHVKGVGNGYVMTFGNTRIYLASDTEDTDEVRAQKGMDVVFLPMNLPYTMTPDQVASALAAMAPKIAYIFHYLDTNPRDLDAHMPPGSPTEIRYREWYGDI
jgi:L-ascorbate metabolism protein UlaG (beta-lactamase superfamily)